jgi:hypothetical protein
LSEPDAGLLTLETPPLILPCFVSIEMEMNTKRLHFGATESKLLAKYSVSALVLLPLEAGADAEKGRFI